MHVPRIERAETLRILFAVTVPITARAVLRGQLSYLAEHGHEVHLATSVGDPFADEADAAITMRHVVPFSRSVLDAVQDVRALWELWRVVRKTKPDLLVVGTPKAGLLGALTARLSGVPCVYVLHGLRLEGETGFYRRVLWLAERLTCVLATHVIAVGDELRQRALSWSLVHQTKSSVPGAGSANGIDLDRFSPATSDESKQFRAVLGIPPSSFTVGFVGRLAPDKGLDIMIDMWPKVIEENHSATLLLVGGVDAPVGSDQEAAKALGNLPNVLAVGEVLDPERYFRVMDVLVLPSKREGLPTVVLEAAACEVPAVMTAATGARDAVAHGETGLVVPMGDAEATARALLSLSNEDRRLAMGRAARARTRDHFEQVTVWENYASLYRGVVHRQT